MAATSETDRLIVVRHLVVVVEMLVEPHDLLQTFVGHFSFELRIYDPSGCSGISASP